MSKTIECFFDVGSPASYLAWTQLPQLAQRQQADLVWKPMLLGGVFQATGNQSPAAIAAKSRYTRMDMQRFARRYGVTLNFNPYFPVNTLMLMRGAVAHLDDGRLQDYLTAIFRALWVDGKDLGQADVTAQTLAAAGFDPEEFLQQVQSPTVKERLKAITAEAVERGVFGAPTLFVNDDMYFGQDRLGMVEEVLTER